MYRQSGVKIMVVGEAIAEDDHTVECDFRGGLPTRDKSASR